MTSASLTRPDARLSIDPASGALTIQLGPIALYGHCEVQLGQTLQRIAGRTVKHITSEPITDQHGSGHLLRADYMARSLGLTLEAAHYDAHRFFAIRLGLTNQSRQTITIHALTPFRSKQFHFTDGPLDGWVNGFHSWGYTGLVTHSERQPRTPFGWLTRPLAHNPTTVYPLQAGRYVSEQVGALIQPGKQALIAGFIGLEDQFGQVYMDGRPDKKSLILQTTADEVPLEPGQTLWGEWAILYCADLPHPDPLGIYAEAVARLTPGRIPTSLPPGWSSWYQFFADVTIADMRRNQQALSTYRDRVPLELIQLDDGYQPAWGDWLATNDKFPDGIARWAEGVRADGFTPGLWLSPFAVSLGSKLAQAHPEMLLRDARGRPVHGGFIISQWLYGLDPTHPATQDFIHRTFETIVHRWGIPYLKLDFLYCGALPGQRYDPTRTRAQALRDGLKLIRQVAGEQTLILGCGCPPGPALGLVDIFRVGIDVAPHWTPRLFGLGFPFKREKTLLSTRNAIRSTLNRAWTHRRWWWLDADNLMAREQQRMTPAEVQSLATVLAMTGSHLVLSDDLPLLSAERLGWVAALLPQMTEASEVRELLAEDIPSTLLRRIDSVAGPYMLIALFNWTAQPTSRSMRWAELGLPDDTPALICDFWKQRASLETGTLEAQDIPPHGVALLAVRPLQEGPQLVGSDLHISMGGEITEWEASAEGLHCTIELGRKAEGTLWLKLPVPPTAATCNGQTTSIKPVGGSELYALSVRVDGIAHIHVQ